MTDASAVTSAPPVPATWRCAARPGPAIWVLLAPLLPLVLGTILFLQLDARAQRELEETLRQSASAAIHAADRLLEHHVTALEALAQAPQFDAGGVRSFRELAMRAFVRELDWLTVRMTDAETGTVILDLAQPNADWRGPIVDSYGFRPVVATGTPRIGGLRRNPDLAEPYVVVRVPVIRETGVRYVLSAAVRAQAFSELLRRLSPGEPWVTMLLDQHQVTVAGTRSAGGTVGALAAPDLVREVERGSQLYFQGTTQEGRRVHAAIETSAISGWTAAVGAPADLIEAPRRHALAVAVGGGALALSLAGLIGASLLRAAARRTAKHEAEAERRLSDVAENFPGVIYRRVRHPSGVITFPYMSPGIKDLLGIGIEKVTPAASLDELARRVVHPDDADRWRATLAASAERLEPYDIEFRVRHPDGAVRWLRSAARAHRGPEGEVIWDGIMTDLSALKQTEAALRESEARFRNMADHAPVMIWVTEADGTDVYLNRRWSEFTGQTLEEGLGFGWLERIHPDDRARARTIFLDANERRAPFRLEYRLQRADGRYEWAIDTAAPRFGPNGEFLGYVGSVIDIGERKAMEEALRVSEERANLAITAGELGTWDWDADSGAMVWSNRCKAIFGLPAEATATFGLYESRLHPDDRDIVLAAMKRAMAPESAHRFMVEHRIVRLDGTVRWVQMHGEAHFGDREGRVAPTRVIGTVKDITDAKLVEEKLRASLREKEFLLQEVHHRVRNNLQGIWGMVQIEAIRLKHLPEARERLEAINERIHVLGRLHQQLYGSKDMSRIELAPYLEQLADNLIALYGRSAEVSLDIAVEPLACDLDTALPLGLIVNELVANSLKHAFPGGSKGTIRVAFRALHDGAVELVVSDDGIGCTAHADKPGIGMTLVRALAQQLQAKIEVEAGRGVRTRIELPHGICNQG